MTGFNKLKVMVVAGTRPEWIRLAATIHALKAAVDTCLLYTSPSPRD